MVDRRHPLFWPMRHAHNVIPRDVFPQANAPALVQTILAIAKNRCDNRALLHLDCEVHFEKVRPATILPLTLSHTTHLDTELNPPRLIIHSRLPQLSQIQNDSLRKQRNVQQPGSRASPTVARACIARLHHLSPSSRPPSYEE